MLAAWNTMARAQEHQRVVHRGTWYGNSGHGGAPSVTNGMRARKSEISNCPPGSCLATVTAVVHEHRDPGIVMTCQTVKDWIGLWVSMTRSQRLEARVALHRAQRRLDKLKHPWIAVCGPLTATIRSLRDVEWEPRKLDEWFQQDGAFWLMRDDAGADSEEVLLELASCLQQAMWCTAVEHHNGRGLDEEERTGRQAVNRVMKKMAVRLEGEGMARLALVVAAAGTWQSERCFKADQKRKRAGVAKKEDAWRHECAQGQWSVPKQEKI